MTINLDSQTIDVPCPGCGKKLKETIGRLKQNPTLTCPGCRQPIKINADQMRREIGRVQKSLDDLTRTLRKFGK